MQRISKSNLLDLMASKNTGAPKTDNAKADKFKKLFGEAVKTPEQSAKTKASDKRRSRSNTLQPDDAALSNTAAQSQQSIADNDGSSEPVQEKPSVVSSVCTGNHLSDIEAAKTQVPLEAMTSSAPEETKTDITAVQIATGNIQDVENTTQQAPVQGQEKDSAQQRFDGMISDARQKLRQLAPTEQQSSEVQAGKLHADSEDITPQEKHKDSVNGAPIIQENESNVKTVFKPLEKDSTTERTELEMHHLQANGATVHTVPLKQPQQLQAGKSIPVVPDQTEQIRSFVVQNLKTQNMEFRMQLQPEELGKIDVKMVLEAGRLSVEIQAASPKTAELLSRQADALAECLQTNESKYQSIQVISEPFSAASWTDSAFHFNMSNGQTQSSGSEGKEFTGDLPISGQEQATDSYPLPDSALKNLLDYTV